MTAQMHETAREANGRLLSDRYARELGPPNSGGKTGRRGKPVVVDGVPYPSARAAARAGGVGESAIRRRIAAGTEGAAWATKG